MDATSARIAEADEAVVVPIRPVTDVRQRNAIMLLPPGMRMPEGWQEAWVKAGWNLVSCAGPEQIPAALHGPGNAALITSPWAEVGKPALRGTVARGLKVITQSAQLNAKTLPKAAASGLLRRAEFLELLERAESDSAESNRVLISIHVDQSARFTTQMRQTVLFDLEERVMQRICAQLRPEDAATIWLELGFGVLVERSSCDEVAMLAERIRMSLSESPFEVDGESLCLTVSIGVALSPATEAGEGGQAWFASACAAQAIASRHGGNQVAGLLSRAYAPMPAERVLILREWAQEAKSCNNIVLEYQPMMPMKESSGELYSVQAKLRDPRAPLAGVGRAEYLRIAREAGAMVMIDRTCLFHALEMLQQEHERGRKTELVVPIEMETLNGSAWRWLQNELRRRGHLAARLILELEGNSGLMSKDSVARIIRLRRHGVRVAVADASGDLGQVWLWARMPLDFLRLPYAAVRRYASPEYRRALRSWQSKGRQQIIDCVDDTAAVSHLAAFDIDHLIGDALVASGPRLDYEFAPPA
jgi:EAL domain-containing protein (putative c-di-GMP-specific phosphodiesterase class I)/GGDEF domain-containing protein